MMNEQQKQVDGLITRIEKHQKALKLSDHQFVARYSRYIGSSRTWRERLCARAWNEFGNRLGKWQKRLTYLLTEIDGGSIPDIFFSELPIAKYGMNVYQILQGTRTDRRCAVLLGNYGIGKSGTLQKLAQENPTTAVYIRANETWKESRMQISRGFADKLGTSHETSAAGTFQGVIKHLKANPLTVMIDEAHEGGILLLKLVKTLIDESKAKFILGIYPTAWNRLVNGSVDSTAEAQQLLGRTLKPIDMRWITGLNVDDVRVYIEAASGLNGECRALAEKILPVIRRGGNLRILADAIELAQDNADQADTELDADLIEEAVHKLCPQPK